MGLVGQVQGAWCGDSAEVEPVGGCLLPSVKLRFPYLWQWSKIITLCCLYITSPGLAQYCPVHCLDN